MDKLELLNKIKWQIYMRLPNGGIYQKCLERIKDRDKDDNINYIFSGSYLEISILEMYLKGYYSVDNYDLANFYKYLLKAPMVSLFIYNGRFYAELIIDGRVIKIPYPDASNHVERITYRFELLDLILPYLKTSYENFSKVSFNEGPYEYKDKDIDVSLKKGDVVLDLGANFGMFSALAASLDCQVYSFEPLLYAVKEYLENLQTFYNNINIINKAVSNTNCCMHLKIDEQNFGGTSLSKNATNNIVKVTTIDTFVEEMGLEKVDFIKADIEGEECNMLEGAKNTLREYAPKLAICAYHNLGDDKKIRKLIKEANPKYTIKSKWKKIYATVN